VVPGVFVDAYDRDALEPVRVADQHASPLVQDRVVGGVPGERERLGHPGHSQVLTHDGL
jgi:hypothetical protein